MHKLKLSGIIKFVGAVAIVALGTSARVSANPVDMTMDYSSAVGSSVHFGSGSMSFQNNQLGNSFTITSSTGVLGDSLGYIGSITGGPLTIGAISGPPIFQTATLTGTEIVTITGGGNTLTMTVDFKDITQVGAGGQLNLNAIANVTGIVEVPGVPSDLKQFADDINQNMTLSWSFSSPMTLTALASTGGTIGYSGQLSATAPVPEVATTAGLLSLTFLGLAAARRKLNC